MKKNMKKIKSMIAGIGAISLAAVIGMAQPDDPEKTAAAVTAAPAATTTVRPAATVRPSSLASPLPSASAAANAAKKTVKKETPMSVMDAPIQQRITKKGMIYEYKATYAHLIGCTSDVKKKKNIKIPSKICVQDIYYDVTMVDYEALKGCKKLEKVTVGQYVKQIRYAAFKGDSKLKKVVFQGKKLKNVGDEAFKKTSPRLQFIMPASVKNKYRKLLRPESPAHALYKGR